MKSQHIRIADDVVYYRDVIVARLAGQNPTLDEEFIEGLERTNTDVIEEFRDEVSEEFKKVQKGGLLTVDEAVKCLSKIIKEYTYNG